MPPPLPTQQGSRAGLITAIVIFVILWLVSTVVYFQERGLRQQAENNEKAVVDKMKGIGPADQTDPNLTAAREEMKESPLNVDNAFDLERKKKEFLAKVITGQAGIPADDAKKFGEGAINKSQATLKAANLQPGDLGLSATQNDSLASTLEKFADAVVKLDAEKRAALAATTASEAKNAALLAQHKTALDSKVAEVKALQDQLAARQADLDAVIAKQATAMTDVNTNTSNQIKQLTDRATAAEQLVVAANAQVPPLVAEIARLKTALKPYRLDPRDNTVRLADGVLTRVPGDGTCYINLGSSDAIAAGMTFEVFDKDRGIPPLNANIEGLDDETARRTKEANDKLTSVQQRGPAGVPGAVGSTATERYDRLPDTFKGSIEVISVGPGHTSQCRIVSVQKGVVIREGDIIANLVYNKAVKFRFATFGDFDLDYNGVPSAPDTATVRRLIVQWGGTVTPLNTPQELEPNTDFLVMGHRPTVPVLSPEDAADAVRMKQVEDAKTAAAQYDAVLDKAKEYSIPVLNQTRFLYYTGYFDLRSR
ncbi:hypothetical protein [Humisphaera borealis]|uniref:Uncharacterized protein n=1 Tax=Humisphaera borealis TaxID=2807512 RepID=A0A7M2WY08_9BACT|nr:hypothetical protein [Humisphaera borealis]QOV90293.1 hypothetical protein IPV69_02665 [Humisphaera borealis]